MAATRRRRAPVRDPSRPSGGLGTGPAQVNGLYVHASPPRVVAVNSGAVRQWLRGGDLDKLQQLVLDGQGARLLGEYSPDARVRAFIRWLPSGLNKVDAAHTAASSGQVAKLESALGAGRASQGGGAGARLPLAMCKDRAGTGLLHKAVFRGQRSCVDWLLDNHPNTVHLKDREGRTPLHYCGACEDPDAMWQRLVDAGADVGAKDNRGRTADYYLEKPDELRLPTSPQHPAESRGRAADTGLVVKPANIRIWIHDRDMSKLQQLLWEGHGARLRNETSKYPIVKRFLDGVPFVMGAVKDVHSAAIAGDLDTFQKRTEEPVPRDILTSKDANGLTPLHKAAGLGHGNIVDDILGRAPNAASLSDAEGRTALHFAALVRDGGEVYNKLVRAGADELAQDNLGRTPEHYKNKPGDLDAGLLRVVPDAPRTSAAYPPNWDWSVISDPAARVFNGRRSYENGDSESASSRDNEDVVAPKQRAGEGEDGQGAVGEGGDGDGDSEASPQADSDAAGGQEGGSLRDGDADADESAEVDDSPGTRQDDVDGDVGEAENADQPDQGDADDVVGADEVAPTDSVPAEEAPVGDDPTEDASNEEAPREEAPDQEAATEASTDEAPVEEASTEDLPSNEVPSDEVPADEAPAEEASTAEASTPAEVSEVGGAQNRTGEDDSFLDTEIRAGGEASTAEASPPAEVSEADAAEMSQASDDGNGSDSDVDTLVGEETSIAEVSSPVEVSEVGSVQIWSAEDDGVPDTEVETQDGGEPDEYVEEGGEGGIDEEVVEQGEVAEQGDQTENVGEDVGDAETEVGDDGGGQDRSTEDGGGQGARAVDGDAEVGGAEGGDAEDGEAEVGEAGDGDAGGGDAGDSEAGDGDTDVADAEGGDAKDGKAEDDDAEDGDAEGGNATGGSGDVVENESVKEDEVGEVVVEDGGVGEASVNEDGNKRDSAQADDVENNNVEEEDNTGDDVEGGEESREAEELDDDQKDVISEKRTESLDQDEEGGAREEEETTDGGENKDDNPQNDTKRDGDDDDAAEGGANANDGEGQDGEDERQADADDGERDAQPDENSDGAQGSGRDVDEGNEERTPGDLEQDVVEDAGGDGAAGESGVDSGVDSGEQESAKVREASEEKEEGEDVVVGDVSDAKGEAQGEAQASNPASTKAMEQSERAPPPSAQEIQTMSLLAPGVRTRRQRLARIVKAITLQKYLAQRVAARVEGPHAARVAAEATANVKSLGKARGRCLWRLASVVVLRTLRWAKKGFPLYDRDWDDPQEEVEDDEAELVEDAEQLLTYTFYPAYSNWRGERARYMWGLLRQEAGNLHLHEHTYDERDERDDIAALRWVKLRLMLPEVLALGRGGRGPAAGGEVEVGDDGGTSALAGVVDSGTNQSAATTVALDGTDLEPEPPPPEPEPEPEPRDKSEEGGRGDFRGRPPTPRPQATLLGDDGGEEEEDEEDEGVGEDDDERDPRDPGQMTDDELDAHIKRGDLGVLADLVLNGEGDRLLNKNSSNPEVQSFLDHVPSYMSKIRAVHDAARAGNLRGLQAALDRRKFAVARDRRSQSACAPLHLAVLLGQTAVVRYLAGRFPETLSARDLRGRTALHYAAVLADNAHYYNMLLNLGANRALKDKSGRTADFYLQHPNTLTHRQLLADIGEPESIADEMFSDKVDDDRVSSRRDVHDAETMALMDRCFRLLHEVDAAQREEAATGAEGMPPAPTPRLVVAYRDLREVPEAPPDRARGDRAAVLRFLPRHVFDLCKRTLTRMDHSVIDVLWPAILDQQDRHRDPVAPNGNPYASRTHDSYMDEAGFVAPDLESYDVFAAVMLPVIKWLNGLDIRAPLRDHPASQFYEEQNGMRATQSVDEVGQNGGLAKQANGTAPAPPPPPPSSQSAIFRLRSDNHLSRSLDIDPGGRVVLRSVVHVARNLTDVRLPLDLSEAQLAEVEDAFRRALLNMDNQHKGPVCARETPRRLSLSLVSGSPAQDPGYRGAGEYFSFPDIPPSAKERLRRARLWPYVPRVREGDEDRLRRLHGRTWPAGRGVFVSGDASLASLVAWVNVHDHVRVMAASADGRGGQIGDVYRRAADCVLGLQKAGCHFARDAKLGFMLARPWDTGCGLRFQATARLPKLGREPDQLASLCRSRGLRLRRTLHPEVFLIANKQVLGVSEHQVYRDYVTAMANIIQLESRVESNSFRLGAVLSRVFRKRPSA